MEGKCALFKAFGNVNAVPICLDTQDVDEIVETVKRLAPAFGGINLEDISAPRCFEIENRLIDELDIPVFHDGLQHGTAIVVLSGVINALRLTGKKKEECRVIVNGAGSAGIAIAKLMLSYGFKNLILCDKCGIICSKSEGTTDAQRAMLKVTNLADEEGFLSDAMRGADIFVGVSAPNIVSEDMVSSMNDDAILFAMANPVPEMLPRCGSPRGRARRRHGPFGLPEPDQQRGRLPRHLQGRPRGARDAHHQRYEARRRLRARRSRVRRGALRGLHHARTLRPARRRGSCRRRAQLRGGLGARAVDARKTYRRACAARFGARRL